MKNLLPLFFAIFLVSCAQETLAPDQVEAFTIQSSIAGASYPVKIAFPEDYDPSAKSYATVYVLDGEENFDMVASQCESLSSKYAKDNVLVVSIGYGNDRALDYTPTEVNENGGGAEAFMSFIQKELIPVMEHQYGADPQRKNRVIVGHSFGGLLAAYAFTNFNDVFGSYLMLSPSLWYDNEILLRYEQEYRTNNATEDQLVFMGLGGLEAGGRMMAPFEAFYQRLALHYSNIQLERNIEPQLEHVGSKNPNIEKGLNFYFQHQ